MDKCIACNGPSNYNRALYQIVPPSMKYLQGSPLCDNCYSYVPPISSVPDPACYISKINPGTLLTYDQMCYEIDLIVKADGAWKDFNSYKIARCDCGGDKSNTTHANWCSNFGK